MKNTLILISFLFSLPLFGQVEDWHPNTKGTKKLQSNVVSAASYTLVCGEKTLIVPGVTTTLTLPQFSVSDQSCYFSFTVKDSTSFDTVKINLVVGDTILGEDCITKATQLILLSNADFQIWKGSQYWEYKSIGSSATSPTVTPLTKGRVIALLDLTSITHANSDPGTKISFTGSPYVSGMTASAGSITPSVSGTYRADWLCMAASTEFLADGIFHVVQNGVSVGQVSYNMNEASAVNQSAGFIDVNLVAGQEVSLHYRTRHTTTDGISWDRGSYFQLTQLPTAVAQVVNTVAEYGSVNIPTGSLITTTLADITGSSFTLPSAGVWEVEYLGTMTTNTNAVHTTLGIYDNLGNLVPNSLSSEYVPLSNGSFNIGQKIRITTTGSATFTMRGTSSSGTAAFKLSTSFVNAAGSNSISWVKIAGQLPSTGQTVDKLHARQTTTQGAPTVGTIINLEGVVSGNIPFVNNTATLEAGKTYLLEGTGAIMAGGSSTYGTRFYNVTTSQFIGESSFAFSPNNANTPTMVARKAVAEITPNVTTQIQLRVDFLSGSAGVIGGSNLVNAGVGAGSNFDPNGASYIRITQIGSSSNTVGTLPAVDQSSAGYFDIGNMRMQWGTTGSVFTNAIITFPAPFANTNYSLSGVVPNNTTALFSTSTTTTTTFTANLWNTNGGGGAVGVVRWIAIGQKP